MNEFVSNSEEETKNLAKLLAEKCSDFSNIICLKGNLGSGKTVFVKGFAEAMGVEPEIIKSPTYTYVRKYKNIYHFDYYRLHKADNLVQEELLEIINLKDSIILIEWPEKIENILPEKRIEVMFEVGDKPNQRIIETIYP